MRRFAVSLLAITALTALSACTDPAKDVGGVSGGGSSSSDPSYGGAGRDGVVTETQRLSQLQKEIQSAQVGDRVYFTTDSVSITDEGRQVLQRQAQFLQRYPTVTLRVEGHADERGTREYNLALGGRRAQSVKEFLMSQGVQSSRLATSTYGKERPESTGSNESAWSRNRRAVSVITAP